MSAVNAHLSVFLFFTFSFFSPFFVFLFFSFIFLIFFFFLISFFSLVLFFFLVSSFFFACPLFLFSPLFFLTPFFPPLFFPTPFFSHLLFVPTFFPHLFLSFFLFFLLFVFPFVFSFFFSCFSSFFLIFSFFIFFIFFYFFPIHFSYFFHFFSCFSFFIFLFGINPCCPEVILSSAFSQCCSVSLRCFLTLCVERTLDATCALLMLHSTDVVCTSHHLDSFRLMTNVNVAKLSARTSKHLHSLQQHFSTYSKPRASSDTETLTALFRRPLEFHRLVRELPLTMRHGRPLSRHHDRT